MAAALSEDVRNLLIPPPSLVPGVRDPYEAPAADIVRPMAELDDPLVHLLGIPFDVTILGRRGAKEGPAGVRRGFLTCLTYEPGPRHRPRHVTRDRRRRRRRRAAHERGGHLGPRQRRWSRRWSAPARRSSCIGGDHGLAFPILRGVSQALAGKRIGVISVDAHFDVRITHHGEPSSGVPFRWILERHPEAFSGRNLVEFGLAGWLNTKRYHDYLVEQGARLMTLRELRRRDWDTVVQEAFDHAADGTDAIWMTFDIDAIEGVDGDGHERARDRRAVAVPGAGPGARVRAAPEGGRPRHHGGVAAAQLDRADGAPGGVADPRLRGRSSTCCGPNRADSAQVAARSSVEAASRTLRAQHGAGRSAKKSTQREPRHVRAGHDGAGRRAHADGTAGGDRCW